MKLKDLLEEGKAHIAQEFISMLKMQNFKQKKDLTYALNELHIEQTEEGQGWREQTRQKIIQKMVALGQQWGGLSDEGAQREVVKIWIYFEGYQAEFTDGLDTWCSRKVDSRILA